MVVVVVVAAAALVVVVVSSRPISDGVFSHCEVKAGVV
jgi:hypothetical protein